VIFYHLQTHRDLDYLEKILGHIYSPNNFYYVSIDPFCPESDESLREAAARSDNIKLSRLAPATWGGFTLLNTTLVGLRAFLDSPPCYRWFLNLSGADLPFKSQARAAEILLGHEAQGIRACFNFGPSTDALHIRPHLPGSSAADMTRFQWRDDVSFEVDSGIRETFRHGVPYSGRFAVAACENIGLKRFLVRPLTEAEYWARQKFFGSRTIRTGKAWHAIHREWAEWLFCHQDFHLALAVFSTVLLSDELFFQTMATDASSIEQDSRISSDNLRLCNGEPVDIHDALEETKAAFSDNSTLFGRKIIPSKARQLLQTVDEICWAERASYARLKASASPVPLGALDTDQSADREPPELRPDRPLMFQHGEEGCAALRDGWGVPEPWGTWSEARSVQIAFRLERPLPSWVQTVRIQLSCRPFVVAQWSMQRICISWTNNSGKTVVLLRPGGEMVTFDLAAAACGTHPQVVIRAELPDAVSVRKILASHDERMLGIQVTQIRAEYLPIVRDSDEEEEGLREADGS
jgi:hypothetical protein